ncbi:MAG: hypothetical protein M1835_004694 [Candelina submexicana]|nr:MAG: hypothetical protein M1835_004694 [Candelina submexicana]
MSSSISSSNGLIKVLDLSLKISLLVFLGATQCVISQLALSPVYGSVPASLHHNYAVSITVIAAFLGKDLWHHRLQSPLCQIIPVFAHWIPSIQSVMFKQSSALGATVGPLFTETFTLLPLLFLSVSYTAFQFKRLDESIGGLLQQWPKWTNAVPYVAIYPFVLIMVKRSNDLISQNVGSSVLLTRTGLQLASSIFYSLLFPSKLLLLATSAMLHTVLYNVHSPHPSALILLNSTLSTHNYIIHARQESITGYISVLENTKDHFRVLRCDHSLLGGNWLQIPHGAKYTSKAGEPIFAVFAMLEAVRLVDLPAPGKSSDAQPDQKTALVIGLGIGTTPAALIAHSVNTTIVEIDPVVYRYANLYFDFPKNHTMVVEDAITFVEKAQGPESGHPKYDYIVHDVFTGGAEPVDLFTHEFLTGLHNLLKPDGVIAINYAGDLLHPTFPRILATIKAIFPTCRLYRENPASTTTTTTTTSPSTDFTNMVIFCLKTPNQTLTFRQPVEADYLGSYVRRESLMPRFEVDVNLFGALLEGGGKRGVTEGRAEEVKALWKNRTAELAKWQKKSAVAHWGIMRKVIPDFVWENW